MRVRNQASQPQFVPKIDRSTQLGRTITHCLPLNGVPVEIVTGTRLTYSSAASFELNSNRGGARALKSDGSGSCASVAIDLSPYNKATVSFWLWWDAYSTADNLALEYGANYIANSGFLVDPSSGAPASGAFQVGMGSTGVSNAAQFTRPSAGAWHHYMLCFNRTTGSVRGNTVYVDGASVSVTGAGSVSDVADQFGNNTLYLFSRAGTSLFGAGKMCNLVIRGGYIGSPEDALAEYQNPWQIYTPPRRRRRSPAAVGGNTYNVSAIETLTLGDVSASNAQLIASLSELLSFADAFTGTRTSPVSTTETVTLADQAVANAVQTGTVQEALALTEQEQATAALVGAAQEALTLTDQPQGTSTRPAAVLEALSLSESQATGGLVIPVSVLESLNFAEALTGTMSALATTLEALFLADGSTATQSAIAATLETLALTDGNVVIAAFNVTVQESLALLDVVRWVSNTALVPTTGFIIALPTRVLLVQWAAVTTIAYPTPDWTVVFSAQLQERNMAKRFSPVDPDEEVVLGFDFSAALGEGETLTTPTVEVTVERGTDAAASAIVKDSTVSGSEVAVAVSGMVDGCDYRIKVLCATSNPLKSPVLSGVLPVRS